MFTGETFAQLVVTAHRKSRNSAHNAVCQACSHRHFANFASFFSACPSSGKPGSSLPQFSVSLRVVPSGRGWWGPAVHNVCFSLRLPLYSAAPAWLWRVAKLRGVVRASGGARVLPQSVLQASHFLPPWLSTGYKSLSRNWLPTMGCSGRCCYE